MRQMQLLNSKNELITKQKQEAQAKENARATEEQQ